MLEPVRAASLLVMAARRAGTLLDLEYDPTEPRDSRGRWTKGGGELSSPNEAVHDILSGQRASVAEADVRSFLKKSLKQAAPVDLTKLRVEGHLIYGGNGLGIARADMPQVPKDMRQQFLEEARKRGITARNENVDPFTLYPTQKEISAQQVALKLEKHEKDPDRQFAPILVSKDNYILDGHHHWGMMATVRLDEPKVRIPVRRLSVGVRAALKEMHAFDERHGIRREAIKAALDWATGRVLKGAEGWDEEEHPRDDAGKFTDKGGSSTPKALTSGRVKSSEKIEGSINHVEKVLLEDEDGKRVEAIFKPVYGESWTGGEHARRQFEETYGVEPESELGQRIITADYDDPLIQNYPAFDPDDYGEFDDDTSVRQSVTNRDFTYADREAAAYEVDQALGLNVIPPTTVRGIDGVKGMVQQYVESDDRPDIRNVDPDSVYGAAILDVAIGNTDRHSGNYLISNGRFIAIDQGLSFPNSNEEYRPEAVVYALQKVSGGMSASFAATIKERLEKTDWEGLTQKWRISSEEKEQFLGRLGKLREAFKVHDTPEDAVAVVMQDLARESEIAGNVDWR